MVFFTKATLKQFRGLKVDELLPEVKVYTSGAPSQTVHLSPVCAGGALESKGVTDSHINPYCESCQTTSEFSTLTKIWDDLTYLSRALDSLEAAEEVSKAVENYGACTSERLGSALFQLRRMLPTQFNILSNQKYLHPLASDLKRRTAKAESSLVKHLHTELGRRETLEGFWHVNTIKGKGTHVVFTLDSLPAAHYAIPEAYGKEIAPSIFLVTGPKQLLSLLLDNCTASLVTLTGSEPDKILEAMALLWDPDSSGVLNDANKALKAAWSLTPM